MAARGCACSSRMFRHHAARSAVSLHRYEPNDTTHLLALAIDMPWMSNKYLELLCAQMEPGRGVLPKIDDRAEPLAAIYPRRGCD